MQMNRKPMSARQRQITFFHLNRRMQQYGQHWKSDPTRQSHPTQPSSAGDQRATGPAPAGESAGESAGADAGEGRVIAGEIIAWRAWRVSEDGYLLSLHVSGFIWLPHRFPPSINATRQFNIKPTPPRIDGAGVIGYYAYKSFDNLMEDVEKTKRWDARSLLYPPTIVLGEVALWGDVIEHQKGYRSEYAYPVSLTECHNDLLSRPEREAVLIRLRKTYL